MNQMLRTIVVGLSVLGAIAAASADAAESPAAPRPIPVQRGYRVVVQVSENGAALWNQVLANLRNIQRDAGAANIDIEVVAIGPGLNMLRDDSLAANAVQELQATGVRFVACRNTMQALHLTEAEMIAGISYVQAGFVEIIRRQGEGFAYLRP